MSQELLNKFLGAINMVEPFQEKFDLSYWQNLTIEEKNIAIQALLEAAEVGNPRALMTLGDLGDKRHIETIKKLPNILHTCDYKAWNTEAATKYYIAATPTFIVLDQDKKIIGKYSSVEQVVK